ncbi:hypothetical protein C8R44DRAFT_892357 [Mycena epipterygia]|nr:hypothetical protein C8R44DRAFT_892357 [Mycena epipterygia]
MLAPSAHPPQGGPHQAQTHAPSPPHSLRASSPSSTENVLHACQGKVLEARPVEKPSSPESRDTQACLGMARLRCQDNRYDRRSRRNSGKNDLQDINISCHPLYWTVLTHLYAWRRPPRAAFSAPSSASVPAITDSASSGQEDLAASSTSQRCTPLPPPPSSILYTPVRIPLPRPCAHQHHRHVTVPKAPVQRAARTEHASDEASTSSSLRAPPTAPAQTRIATSARNDRATPVTTLEVVYGRHLATAHKHKQAISATRA